MKTEDYLPDEWTVVRQWLPADLQGPAQESGFFRRRKGLQNAESWLRLILMHVSGGLSLRQTAVRAKEAGLAEISSVALHKRLKHAEEWLAMLTRHVLGQNLAGLGTQLSRQPLRVIDATNVQEPGNTGTFLRLHYSLTLPDLRCDHYEVTGAEGGEQLGRFTFQPGEIILADRGYSHRAGAAAVQAAGAHFVLRWNPAIFPVLRQGRNFFPLKLLRSLKVGQAVEWEVAFQHEGQTYQARLCGLRKSRQAADKARRKALDKARRNQTEPNPDYLELTNYVLVLTSLSAGRASTAQVLEIYRTRWQVELAFKRLKSLLCLGHVPKTSDDTAKAWLQGKVLVALLIERILLEGRFFSPWGYSAAGGKPMAVLPRGA